MTSVPQTTVAVLFYAYPPAINFARLVADLEAALAGLPHGTRRLGWDCDDVAIVDIDGSRIVVAWADRLPGALPACLAVAIGPGPEADRPDLLTDRADAMAQMIVGRIAARLPAASTLWIKVDGVMTADRLDGVIEGLVETPPAVEEPAAVAPEPEGALARTAAPKEDRPAGTVDAETLDPAALDRLMARMERELNGVRPCAGDPPPAPASDADEPAAPAAGPRVSHAADLPPRPAAPVLKAQPRPHRPPADRARSAGALARAKARAQAAAAATVANDLPDLPRPAHAEMARIRSALYPPEPAVPEAPSTVARVAVGTLGATMVIVATPVGAALLTYNCLRGANLLVTARAVALTGAAFGLMQAPAVQALLSLV